MVSASSNSELQIKYTLQEYRVEEKQCLVWTDGGFLPIYNVSASPSIFNWAHSWKFRVRAQREITVSSAPPRRWVAVSDQSPACRQAEKPNRIKTCHRGSRTVRHSGPWCKMLPLEYHKEKNVLVSGSSEIFFLPQLALIEQKCEQRF